jgi:YjbE family integral membrane protein
MDALFAPTALLELAAVAVIDVALSGDNVVILGLAAVGLPEERRARVIAFGVMLATALRIALALVALPLLEIVGLTLAGGILLLWVAWKIWREIRGDAERRRAGGEGRAPENGAQRKSARTAILQIALADLAMSLDNVLAVAGAAHDHPWVIAVGLSLSVALMAFAARLVASFLARYRALSYLGLAVITIVALRMIWEGSAEVLRTIPLA